MITAAYFGDDRILGISLGEIGIIAAPKLAANFITGEYKASDQTKTFNDLFTFNRAGKAWLVKDSGLVEYGIDVPRFDNGLLIEQSATNALTDSLLKNGEDSFKTKGGSFTFRNDDLLKVGRKVVLFGVPSAAYTYKSYVAPTDSITRMMSMYVSKDNGNKDINLDTIEASSDAWIQGSDYLLTHSNTGNITVMAGIANTTVNRGLVRYGMQQGRSGNIQLHAMQIERGDVPSSLIVSDGSAVTRPADFISSKITTGSKLTGDWDSTLNLALVNGQIVHSGYGRIRSLEIT